MSKETNQHNLKKINDSYRLAQFLKRKLNKKQFEFFINQHQKTCSYSFLEYLTKQKHEVTTHDKESRVLSVFLKSFLSDKELKAFVRFYQKVGLISFQNYLEQLAKEV